MVTWCPPSARRYTWTHLRYTWTHLRYTWTHLGGSLSHLGTAGDTPVTALCHCHGYLVSAIGQKIFLWSLKDNELTGMAFIDTQLYIHQMISVKSFILAADLMKSISLLRYQEESKTLSLVSRVSDSDSDSDNGERDAVPRQPGE
ncbi:cleavage and polyadenylation specificity factor subunit 1 isoform X3 [Cyanistes caeruleus]|uniref:cleavage and polyadenylation specificity factor subunit 1 isoform X3 n=1 Tax=Cyanistes caeruleus TaxID=156563 RepID=UPI000CDAAC78|nr:cleavage and polyadenylation specificity factor subunit 1 isoform X3 [Cyanistes caeruleus]